MRRGKPERPSTEILPQHRNRSHKRRLNRTTGAFSRSVASACRIQLKQNASSTLKPESNRRLRFKIFMAADCPTLASSRNTEPRDRAGFERERDCVPESSAAPAAPECGLSCRSLSGNDMPDLPFTSPRPTPASRWLRATPGQLPRRRFVAQSAHRPSRSTSADGRPRRHLPYFTARNVSIFSGVGTSSSAIVSSPNECAALSG